MEEKMIAIKAAVTAALTALASFLGWKGVMAAVWCVCMGLDWLSGVMAAAKNGQWNSKKARDGVFHKFGMIFVVAVSLLADLALTFGMEYMQMGLAWPGALFPLVLCWYIITEIGSIIENAAAMGAPVPAWLVKTMKIGLKSVDKMADGQDADAKDDT